ncbi:DUF3261 domain-containing protein [Aliiglaciecola lipolytica]|uniref:DUF3261 domain-containing protein n=1 Tax=Aliiglaciecola lipolytica E3 TaxID=1127673 RepID=K6Y4E5_9ALTE|nr:DUF3261 domain-containing protein [Aliiglaciecola lipolytica]GAC13137.1 hypothetical protein GLIP_0491 [Aliiglaciecola lipolytica E3]
MSKRLIIAACVCFFLSACRSLSGIHLQSFPLLLLPPNVGPEPALYNQRLELCANEHCNQLLVVLKIDKSNIKLRGLLPTGQSVYAISYDGKNVTQQSMAENALPAEDILTMLQFALWPEKVIRTFYQSSAGWDLQIDNKYRRLAFKDRAKLHVDYLENGKLVLENFAHNYKVEIETLEYKRL